MGPKGGRISEGRDKAGGGGDGEGEHQQRFRGRKS